MPAPEAVPHPSGHPTLVVEGLRVEGTDRSFRVVDEVSLTVGSGKTLGIVGESGSGKTTVAMALLGFTRAGTVITSGQVRVGGENLLALSPRELTARRGSRISYVPQDPSTGLPPNVRVGALLRQMLAAHGGAGDAADAKIAAILEATQLPSTREFRGRYPFELSGGQQQRVAIALALICEPDVVVMDEPTTGLDVTTQSRLLAVVRELVEESGTSMVYVSHDLGVVRSLADDVSVMYGGRVVEHGPVDKIFSAPRHPYTRGLLEAVPRASRRSYRPRAIPGDAIEPWNWPSGCPFAPRCPDVADHCHDGMPPETRWDDDRLIRCANVAAADARLPMLEPIAWAPAVGAATSGTPVLTVESLDAGYGRRQLFGRATTSAVVKAVSFTVARGECVALVGESGSGKTTTLRCIAGLHLPSAGTIAFDGTPLARDVRSRAADDRRRIQLVPQNPDSSLNPRHTVGDIIARPLALFRRASRAERPARVRELLERVHLRAATAQRNPRELSGGEKQRVAIARALAASPSLLLCDEVVSALDVAVQAGILSLLDELRAQTDMTIVFVTHDLGVVRSVSSRVVVMNQGAICEVGSTQGVFEDPQHPYTRELLAAIPHLGAVDYPGEPSS